jgi:hypothetical protein
MTFHSMPLCERELRATERHLEALYGAAKLGLKGDNLAYAADMTPTELRRLQELDPLALQAIEKGHADGEKEMSEVLFNAAKSGDAKAALEILKHRRDWVAKQQVQVDVSGQISITAALEQAQARVIEGTAEVMTNGHLGQQDRREGLAGLRQIQRPREDADQPPSVPRDGAGQVAGANHRTNPPRGRTRRAPADHPA